MDWGSDLEVASKKLIPRLGRRAGQNNPSDDGRSDDDILDSPASFSSGKSTKQNAPVAPPRTRKTGWGDEFKGGKAKVSNIIEQERFRVTANDETEDGLKNVKKKNIQQSGTHMRSNGSAIASKIPVIPDLDEIQVDNGLADISNAGGSVGINRVAAYKELDKDLLQNEAFAFLDKVNLALLTDKLYPEKMVKEPDEMWSWDLLFTQISSELNSESQKKSDF